MSKLKFILASNSSRRKEILENIGLNFTTKASDFVEIEGLKDPFELVKKNTLGKAKSSAKNQQNAIIIAADTVVFAKNEILEKPKDDEDALRILKILSGSKHSVITGVCVINTATSKLAYDYVETKVEIEKLTPEIIEWYLNSKEGEDKAGGYAIQGLGSLFVKKIEGDYFNVVGLPVFLLKKLLLKIGVKLENVLISEH
jgi:septum formation protein